MELDLTGRDAVYANRKYIAHKAWKTRLVNSVYKTASLLEKSYHWDKKDINKLQTQLEAIRFFASWLEDEGHNKEHQFMNDHEKIAVDVDKCIMLAIEVINNSNPAPPPVPVAQIPEGAAAALPEQFDYCKCNEARKTQIRQHPAAIPVLAKEGGGVF